MDLKIITKFTIATPAGVDALMYLTETIAREKFTDLVAAEVLEKYITDNFNSKSVINGLNDILGRLWLMVFCDGEPAGYAQITSNAIGPDTVTHSAVRIAEFGILKRYDEPLVWQSLYEKCSSVVSSSGTVWLNEYIGNPAIVFFENNGFRKIGAAAQYELPLPSMYLAKNIVLQPS